ncbi:hypothetical protein TREES_T100003890 [Tupaia chinensis]|uniref:Uncharacterized protein n=1 Tax=Tupaia chinensis TaxID=246437 RepID=L9L044_TUPCH|nr:hypothetical protein TREES_T100003890 [Tupaia chinensis]
MDAQCAETEDRGALNRDFAGSRGRCGREHVRGRRPGTAVCTVHVERRGLFLLRRVPAGGTPSEHVALSCPHSCCAPMRVSCTRPGEQMRASAHAVDGPSRPPCGSLRRLAPAAGSLAPYGDETLL